MNLQSASYVIKRARTYLGDVLVTGTTPKFTDEELLDFLNDGLEDIQDLKRKLFRTSVILNVEANKREYNISDFLLNVRRISYKNKCNMEFIDHRQLDKYEKTWAISEGLPTKIVYDYTNPQIFYLYPIPKTNDYQALIIYGDKKLARLTLNEINDLLDIDDRLYKPLIHYIAAEASSIRSVNTDKCDSKTHRDKYKLYVSKINLNKLSQDTDAELEFDYNNGFNHERECVYCNSSDIIPDTILYIVVPIYENGEIIGEAKFRADLLKEGLNLSDFGIFTDKVISLC